MNYIDKTPDGFTTSRITIKLYDIVQPRIGFWKNKLAIITAIKNKYIYCRIIENGMDMQFKVKDVVFCNHNTKTAAKSYFELSERMRNKFIAKYSNIDYIKEHFDTDELIVNDITATTICKGAGIFISNNPDQYNTLAVNWLASNKELISAIIRLGSPDIIEKLHSDDIINCGNNNYIKLIKFFYGED